MALHLKDFDADLQRDLRIIALERRITLHYLIEEILRDRVEQLEKERHHDTKSDT